MATCSFMCLVILLALVAAVLSQSYPRFEFRDKVLTNNSYIPRDNIMDGQDNSLHCVTNNSNCCRPSTGNWYNQTEGEGPNGSNQSYNVVRGVQMVSLTRITGRRSGIWRCDIPDSNGANQSIYIYIGIKAKGRLTSSVLSFTLDTEDPPEFTLTCHSEGGPATTVEWRRNGEIVQEDSNHMTSQIIVDPSRNAVYNNTLRVRGREYGVYKCSVSNNHHDFFNDEFPNTKSAELVVYSSSTPTQFNAIYKSETTILLEWTYDIPITTDYSYVVYYQISQVQGGGHFVVCFNVRRNEENMYSHSLTDLPDVGVYGVSIVAIRGQSHSLPSPIVGPLPPRIEPPVVSISGGGSRVAGTSYTLTCRITIPGGVEPTYPPSFQWRTPHSTSYDTTNITLNPLQETDAGDYVCRAWYIVSFFTSPVVTATFTVTVLSLPAPTLSVRAEGSAVAGSIDYTLVCDIMIPSVSDDITTVTATWTVPFGEFWTETAIAGGDHIYSTTLPLNPLTHDDEGDYTCDAYYTVEEFRSPSSSITYHVTSIFDVLSVEVEGSGSGVVGSLYTLTCTVTLSDRPASGRSVSIQWQGPAGLSHSDDDDTTDNRVVVSQLALGPLTLAHGGDYTCTAEYTVNGHTTTESGNRAVDVIIPSPSVMLRRGHDVIPIGEEAVVYCDIKLKQVKIGNNVTVEVTWLRGSVALSNSTRVTISALTGDITDVHGTLTFSPVRLADTATYECHVTVAPLHGLSSPVTTSDSLLLDVSEPVNPVRPEQVVFINIKAHSVIIQWTVAYISYSPEMYLVQYGINREDLDQNSSVVYSGDDITITSKAYSVELSDLRDNTTYYVQVLATNTAQRSNTSIVVRFTTLPLIEMEAGDAISLSEGDNTASVVGGVLSLVIILISGVSVLVIILLVLKIRSFTSTHNVGGEVEYDHKTVPTATNMAYGMVSHDQRPSGEEVMYEMVNQSQQPSSPQSVRPTAVTDEPAYAEQ